jgi:cold shock CspA family protein
MGRSQESFNKKEVRKNKEKKRKEKEKKRLARKDSEKGSKLEDMIAYVDEFGMITSTPPDPNKKKNIELNDIAISVQKQDPNQQPDPLRKGNVTFFNESKGYGFITDSETNQRIFVHVKDILEPISEGSVVNYEIVSGEKGLAAIKVKVFKKLDLQ